jgi:hypothetical protein
MQDFHPRATGLTLGFLDRDRFSRATRCSLPVLRVPAQNSKRETVPQVPHGLARRDRNAHTAACRPFA